MKEPILIGTRGWEDPAWNGPFYPADLPPEWRFTYYSNLLRAVLVPADRWPTTTAAEVREWPEDSDPAFRFLLDLPPGLAACAPGAEARLAAFRALVAPLAPQVMGYLLRFAPEAPPDPAGFDRVLARLRDPAVPLCVEIAPEHRVPAVLEVLARHDAGLCWRSEAEPAPRPGGRLLVAFARSAEPRAQRALLERLAAWQGERAATAGLFFEGKSAPESAQQARLLAELMLV